MADNFNLNIDFNIDKITGVEKLQKKVNKIKVDVGLGSTKELERQLGKFVPSIAKAKYPLKQVKSFENLPGLEKLGDKIKLQYKKIDQYRLAMEAKQIAAAKEAQKRKIALLETERKLNNVLRQQVEIRSRLWKQESSLRKRRREFLEAQKASQKGEILTQKQKASLYVGLPPKINEQIQDLEKKRLESFAKSKQIKSYIDKITEKPKFAPKELEDPRAPILSEIEKARIRSAKKLERLQKMEQQTIKPAKPLKEGEIPTTLRAGLLRLNLPTPTQYRLEKRKIQLEQQREMAKAASLETAYSAIKSLPKTPPPPPPKEDVFTKIKKIYNKEQKKFDNEVKKKLSKITSYKKAAERADELSTNVVGEVFTQLMKRRIEQGKIPSTFSEFVKFSKELRGKSLAQLYGKRQEAIKDFTPTEEKIRYSREQIMSNPEFRELSRKRQKELLSQSTEAFEEDKINARAAKLALSSRGPLKVYGTILSGLIDNFSDALPPQKIAQFKGLSDRIALELRKFQRITLPEEKLKDFDKQTQKIFNRLGAEFKTPQGKLKPLNFGDLPKKGQINVQDMFGPILRQPEKLWLPGHGTTGLTGNFAGYNARAIHGTRVQLKDLGAAAAAALKRFLAWSAGVAIFFGVQKAVRDTVSTVIEFEKQMIRLKQVLPPVVSNLEEIEKGVFKTARTYGQSVSEIQQAMVIWAQQGRNVQEILEGTNNAALLANTTTLTLAQSIELLTVGVGVFNKDFKDMGEIVDSVNVIEQRHALTANDLLRALQRTGSSAHELGLSLNEYFGIVAGIVPKTRESGQRIGTALKTIFGRVVRPQFIDEVAKYGIEVSKTGLELRNLMDILKDIANVWDSLTEIQKVNIARAAGGYRQYAIGMTLFSNFEEVLRAVTDAEFSRGASMRENLVTMESVSKKIQVMRASLDELKKSLGDSGLKGFITDIIGLITKGSDFLNSLSGTSKKLTLGGGGSILGGLGLAAGGIQATKFLNVLVGGTGFAPYGQAQKTIVKGIVSGKLEPEALRDFDSYLSTVNGALAKQRVSLYLLQRSQLKNLEGMKALYQSLGLLATMATGVAAYFAILRYSTKQLEQTEKSLAEERKKSITGSASPETIKAATRQRAVVGAEQFAGTAGVVSLLVPQKLRSLALVLSSLLTYKKYQKIIKEQEKDLRRELTLTVDTAVGNAQQMSSEFSKIISLLQTPIDKRDMQWFTNFEEASDTITKRINTLKKEFGNLDVFGKLQGAISGKNLRQVENIARVLNAAAQAKAGKIGLIEQQTTLAGKTKLTPEEIDNAINAASLNILSMARFAAMAGVSLDKFQKTIPSDKFIKEIREGMEKVATKAFLTEKGIQLNALPSTFAKSFLSTQQIARQTGVQTTGTSGIKMENLTREFAAALAKEQKSGLFQAIAKTAQGYVTGIFDATGKLIGVFDAGGKQLDKEFTQMAKTFRVVVPLVQKQLLSIWTPEHQKRMFDAFSTMISNIGDEAMRAFGQKDMVSDFKKSILEMNFAVQDAIKKGQITSGGLAEPYVRSEIVREFRGQIEKALRGMSVGGDMLSKLRKTTYEQTRANAAAIEAFLTRSPKLAQISKSTKTPDEITDLIDTTFDSIRERIKDIPGGFYALSEIQRQFTSLATKGGKETGFDEFGQKLVASLTKGIEDFNKVQAQVFSKMKSGVINPLLSAYSKLESRGTAIKSSMESLFDVGLVENLSSISGFYNSQVSALQKVKAQEEDINRIRFEGQAKITELLKKSFDDMIQKGLQTFGMSRKQQREQRKAFRNIARTIGGLRLGDLRGLNSAQLQRIGDVTGLSRLSVEDRKAIISALSSVPAGARFPGGQTAKEIKNIIGTIFSGTAEGANAADIGGLLKDSIQTQEKMAYALFGMESKKLSDIYNEIVRKLTPIDNTLKRILAKTATSPANKLGFDAREFSNIQSMIENSGVSDISNNTKKIYELLSSKEYSKDLTDAIKEASNINKKELKPSRTKALAKDALGIAGGYAAYEATKYGGKKLLNKIPTKEIGDTIKKKATDFGFLELIRRGFSKIFSRAGGKVAQEAAGEATKQSTKRLAPKALKETSEAIIRTASKLKGKVPTNVPGISVGGPIAVAGTVAGVAGLSYLKHKERESLSKSESIDKIRKLYEEENYQQLSAIANQNKPVNTRYVPQFVGGLGTMTDISRTFETADKKTMFEIDLARKALSSLRKKEESEARSILSSPSSVNTQIRDVVNQQNDQLPQAVNEALNKWIDQTSKYAERLSSGLLRETQLDTGPIKQLESSQLNLKDTIEKNSDTISALTTALERIDFTPKQIIQPTKVREIRTIETLEAKVTSDVKQNNEYSQPTNSIPVPTNINEHTPELVADINRRTILA